jgi:hypothetical protein
MRLHVSILFGAALLVATPVLAADPATPLETTTPTGASSQPIAAPATAAATPAPTTTVAAAPVADPVICHSQPVTGSRLGVARVCMKQSEWDARTRRDQRNLERMEEHAYMPEGH